MPKPISRILGAARPNRRSRSSGIVEKGTPYTGSSSVWARRWAFETRPWRKTKLRIGRRSCKESGDPVKPGQLLLVILSVAKDLLFDAAKSRFFGLRPQNDTSLEGASTPLWAKSC